MTEQLTGLLSRYADDMAAGHTAPPPPPVAGTVRRGRRRWAWRVALPALAAASVVAIAVGTAQLGAGTPPGVVAVTAAEPPELPRDGDTPPPPSVLFEPPNGPRDPVVVPPPGRDHLRVTVEPPPSAVVEELTPYTVVLTNPGDQPVSLRPCPAYRIEYGGQGSAGRLPCERLPDAVQPGQTLRVALMAQFGFWDGPDMPSMDIDVAWGIAGPPTARGRLRLDPLPLGEPIATAPFTTAPAPPGEPTDPIHGMQRGQRPAWNLVPTIIAAPTNVRAGETLRYTVRLVNVSPNDAEPLRPCRGFTQWLQRPIRPTEEPVAYLDWSFERHEIKSLQSEEHMLNCESLPAELPPRKWVRLEMELQVPADYPPGKASLAWKVGELDNFGSRQTRYVTINVVD